MIGTKLIEELVQSVALTHRVAGHSRASLLLMATPESGKTTITMAADSKHVLRIAMITGRSVVREVRDHPETEFFLFNDLTAVRALSQTAVNMLINLLNQFTQDEHGLVAFAGKDTEKIERQIGIIGCLPFDTFRHHKARWRELGFVSRMIPFCYKYPLTLIAEIKDAIDDGTHKESTKPHDKMIKAPARPVTIRMEWKFTRRVRHLSDARASTLGELGFRLLKNYHVLIRAHALLKGRNRVTDDDWEFLKAVDRYVSITECRALEKNGRV